MWDQRKQIYQERGGLDLIITTDELNGISDEKIEALIEKLINNDFESESSDDRYSNFHFSLR